MPGTRLRVVAAEAVALGLIGAWTELAVMLAHQSLVGTVTRVTYRYHWYRVALSVPAHLAILGAWLLVVALLWIRPSRRSRVDPVASTVAWFLAIVSPLLAIEELYWPCSLVLALGLALRITPRWRLRRTAILRRGLPALALLSAGLTFAAFVSQQRHEARALSALPAAPADAPNVVLLVLDTVRADHLSLYGYARDTSPHLKALGDRAVVFDLARSPAPWTLPSHATMFTGRWPHELSVDIDRPLTRDVPTLAGFLSEQGYATAGFTGNLFYTNAWFGLDRGFSRYDDAPENKTLSVQETLRSAALGRALMPLAVRLKLWPSTGQFPIRRRAEDIRKDALQWVDAQDRARPFFLFLNYFDAHDPYIVPQEFPTRYSWPDRARVHQANRKYNGHAAEDDARKTAQGPVDPVLNGVMIDAYDDCLRYVDDQIARLMAELKARGLDRNTWVIITADHGEQFNDHGLTRHGGSLYRCEVDVPLLIVPPAGSPTSAVRVAEPVSPRDLPATVADLVGKATQSPFPGLSLRRFWDPEDFTSVEGDSPVSELKLPADLLKAKPVTRLDSFKTAIVGEGRIYHHSPSQHEELYHVDDRPEASNLINGPEEAATLGRLRHDLDAMRSGAPR